LIPFKALYDCDSPNIVPYHGKNIVVDDVDQLLLVRDNVLEKITQNLLKAQMQMKKSNKLFTAGGRYNFRLETWFT